MTRSPLADEEELLRLIEAGLSQKRIAEAKHVSQEAVRQRLKALQPVLAERGLSVHRERQSRQLWVPWKLPDKWRFTLPVKRLKLLGRTIDGPALDETEERLLQAFLDKLDHYEPFDGGRGVVAYQGDEVGFRIVPRKPWDRGYIRWPEGAPDTRPLPPELVLPDEPYTDAKELSIWKLTDLTPEERHERIMSMRRRRTKTRSGERQRTAS